MTTQATATKKNMGPTISFINKDSIPKAVHTRGQQAFILELPFWALLSEKLEKGLGEFEAVDINLQPTYNPAGELVEVRQMANRIRYQFHKLGWDKKYALIQGHNGNANNLYVVDHNCAAELVDAAE